MAAATENNCEHIVISSALTSKTFTIMHRKVISAFFKESQARINQQLNSPEQVTARFMSLYLPGGKPRPPANPDEEADHFHFQLLFAAFTEREEGRGPDDVFYFAASAADSLARTAVISALDKGQLGELSSQVQEMRRQAGFVGLHGWAVGEGPPQYEEICNRISELMTKVHSTVMVETLTRYKLSRLVKFWEKDPVIFTRKLEELRSTRHGSAALFKRRSMRAMLDIAKLYRNFGPVAEKVLVLRFRSADKRVGAAMNRRFLSYQRRQAQSTMTVSAQQDSQLST